MVSYLALRDANPTAWRAATDSWVTLAKQCEQSATDIYHQGTDRLTERWKDAAGDLAANELASLANSYQVAGTTIRGVAMTLEGLGEAAGVAQRALLSALDYARQHGMVVDETTGRASYPTVGPYSGDKEHALRLANDLVADAVTAATRIDEEASAELNKLALAANNDDLDQAKKYQNEAAQDQLNLFKQSLPKEKSPEVVRAWWDSLSAQERTDYERAVPVDLYDLKGIPDDVKQRLRGDNGYSAVDAVRWAEENWNNTDIDKYQENCANFVSHALNDGGGLPQKDDAVGGTLRSDNWANTSPTGNNWVDGHLPTSTHSWSGADAQRQFFLDHGGEQVPLSETRPGDVVYWVQQGEGDVPAGEARHAALVTAVTPDGDIHYTQHTDPRINTSLNGRMPSYQVEVGQLQPVVVRPKRTW